uniref:WD repeat containing, antisense to TP73 n=1 Tax=Fundulus heteroclitus TaxID=8078 RepID=A0A3Q2QM63_FUNHE
MNFSEVFKQSNQLCKVSPNGNTVTCVQYRLVVRDVSTLQILQLYTCLDQISHMEWSSDSLFILCAMYKRGLVQVWSLEQPEWHCKIDEGSIGLVSSRWSPDGRHILNTTEFHLRITVWSLCTKAVSYIKYPKACQKGIDFSRDGRYMALAERRDCKDYVSIFVCDDWHLLRVSRTLTCVFSVWWVALNYKVLLYSLDGRLLSTYCAYEWSLGVKSVSWSPSSQFLAIGSYDEKVRILNHITWKKIVQFEHPAALDNTKTVYKEVERRPAVVSDELSLHDVTMGSTLFNTQSKYEICTLPVQIPAVKPDPDRANPKIGVSVMAFSSDSRYLATKNVMHLIDFLILFFLLILQHFETETQDLAGLEWSPNGCVFSDLFIPLLGPSGGFQVQSLNWHCSGDSVILLGKEQLCLCYMDTDPEEK